MPIGQISDEAATSRAIVDSNLQVTNVLNLDDSKARETVLKTLKTCIEILSTSCGPQAGYAMLISNYDSANAFNPSIFTRDGIGTLESVDFMSPLERYIQLLLTYIGKRVDDKAKDGTTSSMIFSACLISSLIENRDKIKAARMSIFHMNLVVERIFSLLRKHLEENSWTVEQLAGKTEEHEPTTAEIMHAAGQVAFCQALSSSGGNVALAKALKEIFEHSHPQTWGYISFQQSHLETGSPWEVIYPEYDASISCSIEVSGVMNAYAESEMIYENVKVLATTASLNDASLVAEMVKDLIENAPDDRPLVIIGKTVSGEIISRAYTQNKLRKHPIILVQHTPGTRLNGQPYNWDLLVLNAISGSVAVNESEMEAITEKNFFTASKVHWKSSSLYFYGLYEHEENETMHPYSAHPETATQFYKDMLETALQMKKENDEGHLHDERLRLIYVKAINDLISPRRPFLKLGGTAHEQLANKDVAQDALGAIQTSLRFGFVNSGILPATIAAMQVTQDILNDTTGVFIEQEQHEGRPTRMGQFATLIAESLISSFRRIGSIVFGEQTVVDIIQRSLTRDEYLNALDPYMCDCGHIDEKIRCFSQFVGNIDKMLPEEVDAMDPAVIDIGMTYPVLQPIPITQELLLRAQELLLKFALTDKLVIRGGVVAGELKHQKE